MADKDQQEEVAQKLEEAVHTNRPDATFRWKAMFGGAGYYVDEVIFASLYSDGQLALKLPEADRQELADRGETSPNSKQYITIPETDVNDPEKLSAWVRKSMAHVAGNKKKK
jgi:TfoX/Sxy family transcriptional regulator of competence genes